MGRLPNPNSPSRLAQAAREEKKKQILNGEIVNIEKRGRPPGTTSKDKNKIEKRAAFRSAPITGNDDESLPMSRKYLTNNSWCASEEEIASWYKSGEIPICVV